MLSYFCETKISSSPYVASNHNSSFYQHNSFNQYIDYARALIKDNRVDLNNDNSALIIEQNSPKQDIKHNSAQGDHGIIFVHGLFDSCSIMDSLYQYFSENGYSVMSLLLPGHGTRPADLLNTNADQWLLALRFAINCLRPQVDTLSIVGLSTGANLAMYLAQESLPIDSVVLFAPALKIKPAVTLLSPLLSPMSHVFPWIKKYQEIDYAKYQSITFNGVYQVQVLANKVRQNLLTTPFKTPCFMVLSDDDETICSQYAKKQFDQFTHSNNELLLYSNKYSTHSNNKHHTIQSCIPEQRILNLSHPCLPVSPNHIHYGKQGDIQAVLRQYSANNNQYQGALTIENIRHYHIQRLLYNPFFDDMVKRINQFLLRIKNKQENKP